jgi:hypothetical protein
MVSFMIWLLGGSQSLSDGFDAEKIVPSMVSCLFEVNWTTESTLDQTETYLT